ncbi:MAG: TldD/PmbA family protein [Chloroflexi bacterium]|nr:TldD/PmbA family protein [Chloroflexota bacterium]
MVVESQNRLAFLIEVLALAKKRTDEAEVYGAWSEETPVRFEANRLKEVQGKQSSVVALRVVKSGRIGLALGSGVDDAGAIVAMALDTAPYGPEAQFEFPGAGAYPEVPVFDGEVVATPVAEMAGLGERLIGRVRKHNPDLLCDATVSKTTSEVRVLNSRGGSAGYVKSVSVVGLEGVLVQGQDMLFVGDVQTSCHPPGEATEVTDVTLWQLEMAKRRATVTSGDMPVIFTPRAVAGAFASALSVGFNGRTVLEGASPLKGRLGEKLFDPKLRLYDDPLSAYRTESRPCDDEGVPSRVTTLVDRGTAVKFLYDLQTAGMVGTTSTGSGSRGRGGMPGPGIACLVFGEGDASLEDMVVGMKEGLVVEQLIGAEQGNVLGGDFSGNVLLGFKVERGELVGRVKDVMVSGNVYQALKAVVAMGKESRYVYGTVKSPHIWLERLSVAAKV